jgi:hypothetical protein
VLNHRPFWGYASVDLKGLRNYAVKYRLTYRDISVQSVYLRRGGDHELTSRLSPVRAEYPWSSGVP